jgi:hypothetical protein
MILLDTNLLTRMTRAHDPQSGVARAAIQTLLVRGEGCGNPPAGRTSRRA